MKVFGIVTKQRQVDGCMLLLCSYRVFFECLLLRYQSLMELELFLQLKDLLLLVLMCEQGGHQTITGAAVALQRLIMLIRFKHAAHAACSCAAFGSRSAGTASAEYATTALARCCACRGIGVKLVLMMVRCCQVFRCCSRRALLLVYYATFDLDAHFKCMYLFL